MPIYQYRCETCNRDWKEMHGADDKGGLCNSCNIYSKRNLPSTQTILTEAGISDAGRRVERYIEENRQIVREQIEEARQEYKP